METFFGKPINYWCELQAQAKKFNYDGLIEEIAVLKYKIRKYEECLELMLEYRERLK